jgi:hypothetical protein
LSQIERIASEYLGLQGEEAREAGAVGYIGRCIVQATLPHSEPKDCSFERKNGLYVLSITAPKSIGLPYGIFPRLVLMWMTGEVVRTQQPHLLLGDRLGDFMSDLGISPTGGARGTITYLREQMKRLFSSSIDFYCVQHDHAAGSGMRVADNFELWWTPRGPHHSDLWMSYVELSPKFFAELRDFSIPDDLRRVKMLRRSPLAFDIYTWWTYRFSYLRKQTEVPWEALYLQFGANYATLRQFRYEFRAAIQKAHKAYPEAKIEEGKYGLILRPSPPSVPKLTVPVGPILASPERAARWIKRFPGKYRKFLRELNLIKVAMVGQRVMDQRAEIQDRAELAAERSGVPFEIAYRLVALDEA